MGLDSDVGKLSRSKCGISVGTFPGDQSLKRKSLERTTQGVRGRTSWLRLGHFVSKACRPRAATSLLCGPAQGGQRSMAIYNVNLLHIPDPFGTELEFFRASPAGLLMSAGSGAMFGRS